MPVQKQTPNTEMPSADLINYRFDEQNTKLGSIEAKLDGFMGNFVTREEFQRLVSRLWWAIGIFASLAIALIAAYIERH